MDEMDETEKLMKKWLEKKNDMWDSYKEPSESLSLAVPTNCANYTGGDKQQYYPQNPDLKIRMACGCTTRAYLIGAQECKLIKLYGNFDVEQQPKNDFLLTLFCGNCGKQITKPLSAWKINKHGGANWIMQNSTETFQ